MLTSPEPRGVLLFVAIWFVAESVRSQKLTVVFAAIELFDVVAKITSRRCRRKRMRMRIINLPEPNNETESESKIIRVRICYSANIRFPTNRIPPAEAYCGAGSIGI
jgi:hypothetical protein